MNIARLVSDKWREMGQQERESWEERARQDKARYMNEKLHYEGPWKVPANKRKPKDPTSPKKPVPAYFAFSNARRQLIKNENPTATNAEISRILAKMWKEAPEDVRNVYLEEEAGRREEHAIAMEKWRRENKKHQEQEGALAAEQARNIVHHVSVSADGSSSDDPLGKNGSNNLENQARNSDSVNESSTSNINHQIQDSYNMPGNFQQSQQLSFGTFAAGSTGMQGSLQQPFLNSSQQQFQMNPGSLQQPAQQQQIPENLFASTAAALAAVNGDASAAAALLAATNPGLGSALLNTNLLGGLAQGISSLSNPGQASSNGQQGLSLPNGQSLSSLVSNGQGFSLPNNGQQGMATNQQQQQQQQPTQVQQAPQQQQQPQQFNGMQAIPQQALLEALLGGQLGIQLGDQGGGQQLNNQLNQQLLQQLLQQVGQPQQQQPNPQLSQQFGQMQQLNQQFGQRQLNQQQPQQQQQQYGQQQQQQHNQQQQLGQQLNGQHLSQQLSQQLSQVLGVSQDQRRGSGN